MTQAIIDTSKTTLHVYVHDDIKPIPSYISDAVNHAIHTSSIDGNLQPISLCYVAVRAALAAIEKYKEIA